MMPLPFQMLAAALIAYLIRVNIPSAIACTWVSNPLTTPLFFWRSTSLAVCSWEELQSASRPRMCLTLLSQAPLPLLIGAFLSGVVLFLAAYPLALKGWDWFVRAVILSPAPGQVRKKTSRNAQKSSLV